MKKVLSIVLAAAMVSVVAMSLTACGEKPAAPGPAVTEAAPVETEAPTEVPTEAPVVETEAEAAAPAGEALVVAFEDFDGMQALSKKIQNGEVVGQIVEIEGLTDKIGSGYSIGEKKDGTFVGTKYEFDGEYPANGAHVKLVGEVFDAGSMVFKIKATSIEVIE